MSGARWEEEPVFLLAIDHGKAPNWLAADAAIKALKVSGGDGWTEVERNFTEQVAEFDGFPEEDGTPEQQARDKLLAELGEVNEEWLHATKPGKHGRSNWYEIRELPHRGVDLHLLHGEDNEGVGLTGTGAAYALEDVGVFVALGFDC